MNFVFNIHHWPSQSYVIADLLPGPGSGRRLYFCGHVLCCFLPNSLRHKVGSVGVHFVPYKEAKLRH